MYNIYIYSYYDYYLWDIIRYDQLPISSGLPSGCSTKAWKPFKGLSIIYLRCWFSLAMFKRGHTSESVLFPWEVHYKCHSWATYGDMFPSWRIGSKDCMSWCDWRPVSLHAHESCHFLGKHMLQEDGYIVHVPLLLLFFYGAGVLVMIKFCSAYWNPTYG